MKSKKPKLKDSVKRLLKNAYESNPKLFLFCALFTVFALAVPILSVAFPKVIIAYLIGGAPTTLGVVIIASVFFVAAGFCNFFEQWFDDFTYPRITALRLDYIRRESVKLLGMDYKYMESATFWDNNSNALQATMSNSNGIEGIYHKLFALPKLLLTVLILSVFIGIKSPVIISAMLINMAASVFVAIRVQKYNYDLRDKLAKHERRVDYHSRTAKDFSYGKDIRLYDLRKRISDNFGFAIKGYTDVFRLIKNREYLLGFITLFTLLLSDVAVYGTLTYLTFHGMPIDDYSMYITAAVTLSAQMSALTNNVTTIIRENLYVSDYFVFMDTDHGEKGGSLTAPSDGSPLEIEFRNVTFRYPETEKNIFENFSLKIPAGQKLALVGINGAGKTTFAKLLTGLYKPDSGSILINGNDISMYDKASLYGMFAAVFQEVNVLALTVAENVACTSDNIDYEKVDRVLKDVGLYEKVQSLPKKADTVMLKIIDDDGAVFSGGENQKLAIARALYNGGRCIIMDEPTAALDALAEAEIYSEFNTLTQNKTAIYISHRLASTKFCDKIALIDGNGLAEYGTHDELMKKGGKYYAMFDTQGKYYQEEAVV